MVKVVGFRRNKRGLVSQRFWYTTYSGWSSESIIYVNEKKEIPISFFVLNNLTRPI